MRTNPPNKQNPLSFVLRQSLTLRRIANLILPLTLISVMIAIGSVLAHQWEMRLHLSEEDYQIATDPALELTLVAPLVLIPPLLFSVAALWFTTSQIIQPLQRLESQAAALAWGNFDAIQNPVGGIPEIQHLQLELVEMARKLKKAQEGLHDYIGAITFAQEEERARLARELHDDTIQAVIALKQRVALAQKSIHDEREKQSLKELETLAEQTIDNLRRLTKGLRPIYLEDLGLVAALHTLTREIEHTYLIDVAFQMIGKERRLPYEIELSLYRIAQEALNNTIKHANATHASLTISYSPSEIVLEIIDNGLGFTVPQSPTEFAAQGHFGLLGIYERSILIGAQLEIYSSTSNGTRLLVRLT
ncbi:MAG: sensor histidine kinase [Chloroflexota bacterium]